MDKKTKECTYTLSTCNFTEDQLATINETILVIDKVLDEVTDQVFIKLFVVERLYQMYNNEVIGIPEIYKSLKDVGYSLDHKKDEQTGQSPCRRASGYPLPLHPTEE